jgi:hypothetical protein
MFIGCGVCSRVLSEESWIDGVLDVENCIRRLEIIKVLEKISIIEAL